MPTPTQVHPRRNPPPSRGAAAGFSLIELMIAVAIVGILAMVAYPSYQQYIRRGNRADAHALLQAAQLAQEKYRLGNTTYASTTAALKPACPESGQCFSARGHYELQAPSGVSGSAYTLTAKAFSDIQKGDESTCQTITLTVTGGVTSYGPDAKCWSR